MDELITYIESKGFTVQAQSGGLTISKLIDGHGRTAGRIWPVSAYDIERTPWETLRELADERMHWIDTQIAQVYK